MKDKIKKLVANINQARIDYYNGESKVTDRVYDAWYDELKSLDPENPAIINVGAPPADEWKKVRHKIPMPSLNKVNTPEELESWSNRCKGQEYLVLDKLDGLSIECVYENGMLIEASSRGDGEIGQDLLQNVRKMRGVKLVLDNFTGSIRGEIMLMKSLYKKHFSDKANCRNAASGIVNRLDGVGSEHLTIMFYNVVGDAEFETESGQLDWIKNKGLLTPNYTHCKTIKDVVSLWNKYQESKRESLDYEIDGLVIRISDVAAQMKISDIGNRPGHSIAFKFDAETRTTTITQIDWQVGSSGRVTPVANFESVNIMGAKIARASLYNYSYVDELGIDVGAEVLVARNNDVIPCVVEVITGTGKTIQKPKNCPECKTKLITDGEYIICPNVNTCPAQVKGRIENWINQLNLLEWGSELIARLVESNKVVTIADLYRLSIADIASMDRMGDKSAKKCYDILWNNTEVSLENLLGGLSIPMVGASIIKMVISSGHDTLDKILGLNVDQLEAVNGLGPAKAASLYEGLKNNKDLVNELLGLGITIKQKTAGKLSGKSFAITGSLSMKRSEVEKIIEDNGGIVKSSVGRGLNFLLIADPESTSSKAVSARKLGTTLINEKTFMKMI